MLKSENKKSKMNILAVYMFLSTVYGGVTVLQYLVTYDMKKENK